MFTSFTVSLDYWPKKKDSFIQSWRNFEWNTLVYEITVMNFSLMGTVQEKQLGVLVKDLLILENWMSMHEKKLGFI